LDLLKCIYEECKPDKKALSYVANLSSIHLIVSGHGYFNGKRLSGGEGFTVLENEYVTYYPDKTDPWVYVWINFKNDDFILSSGILTADRTFIWENDVSNLKEEINGLSGKDKLYQIGKVYILLSKIKREASPSSVDKKRASEIKEYLRNYFADIKSLNDVAEHFSISRAYMRNIFVKHYSLSPQAYLINLRLERACVLLKSNIPINTVAISVGYGDQLQFSRLFRKHKGISPSEYRTKDLSK